MATSMRYDYKAFLEAIKKAADGHSLRCGKGYIGADQHCLLLSVDDVHEHPAADYHKSVQHATIYFWDEYVREAYRHEKTKEPQTDVFVLSDDVLPSIDRMHSIPNALLGVEAIDDGNVTLLVKQELLGSLEERVRSYFNLTSQGKVKIGVPFRD